MPYTFLDTRREGPVEYLTLNRPDVRNAFNEQVIAELSAWAADARAAAERREVRAAVLAGAGRTFSAGADVTWLAKTVHYTEEENLRDATAMSRMFPALDNLPVPLSGRTPGGRRCESAHSSVLGPSGRRCLVGHHEGPRREARLA